MIAEQTITQQEIEGHRLEGVKLHWRGESRELQQMFDRLPLLAIARHNSLVQAIVLQNEQYEQRIAHLEQQLSQG